MGDKNMLGHQVSPSIIRVGITLIHVETLENEKWNYLCWHSHVCSVFCACDEFPQNQLSLSWLIVPCPLILEPRMAVLEGGMLRGQVYRRQPWAPGRPTEISSSTETAKQGARTLFAESVNKGLQNRCGHKTFVCWASNAWQVSEDTRRAPWRLS